MKRRCSILLLLAGLMLMAGCHSPEAKVPTPVEGPTESLCTVDSLMWRQPDSAFALLVDFAGSPNADSLDAFNGHYFHLLLSELFYKNYYEQSNRPELRQAVAYFDSLTLALNGKRRPPRLHRGLNPRFQNLNDFLFFLDARSHYINGVGYYEQDSVVEACKEYLEVLEIMEEQFTEKELIGQKAQFMAYTFNRLGSLFSEQFMMDPSINCYEQSLIYCRIEPTSLHGEANTLYQIGKQYDKKNEPDRAKFYFEQALERMQSCDNLLFRDIVSSKAVCDYQLGLELEIVMDEMRKTVTHADNEAELLNRYLTIGTIYGEERQYDSALFYIIPVFQKEMKEVSKIRAAERMRNIYESIGDKEKSDECVLFLAKHRQSEGENKALVSRLEDLFKNYMNQQIGKQSELARRKSVRKTAGLILLIAVAITLVFIIVAKTKSKKQLMAKEKRHQQEMDAERQTHKMQQAALSGRLKKSNEELRELRGQIRRRDDLATNTERVESFSEEPVCRLIMERVRDGQFKAQIDYKIYKDYALDNEQVLALREAADRHFKQFTARLARAYPALTKSDFDYCCLYLLGLSDADVSALMQRAYTTVSERSRKLRDVFGVKQPLPVMLQSFANESYSS